MGLARICDSMLIELNMYLKRPLISTKNEFNISGSFWGSLYLEKTDPYCWGILEKNFYSKLIKIKPPKYNSHIDCVAGWKYIL